MLRRCLAHFACFLVVATVSATSVLCQTPTADSLMQLLPLEKNDSLRIVMLRDIGFDYYRTNATKSAEYLLQARDLAKKTNNTFQYFGAIMDYGSLQIELSKFDTAILIFKKLLAEPYAETNYKLKAAALGNLATAYLNQDKYIAAQQCYLQAIALYENNRDEQQLSIPYGNICFVYLELKQYQNTIDYANRLYLLSTKNNDMESKVTALGFMATSYIRMGKPEKSIGLLKESLVLSLLQQNASQRFELYATFGEYYLAIKDYHQAVVSLTKADSISKKLTNSKHRGSNLVLLGKAYALGNNYRKASKVLEEAALALSGRGKKNERRQLYLIVAETEEKLGNYKKANKYLHRYAELKDSIYDEGTSATIAELEINYQTEKKEKDILMLQLESKRKTVSIARNKTYSYLLLGISVILLLVFLLSYWNYKQKRQLQQQRINQLENEKLLLASESILKGQEDERSRMAQDLHDGLGGMLSGVKLTLSTMKGNILITEENARLFTKAFEQLDSSIGEMRRVAHNMMPEALVKLGLQQALQDYCDAINESKQLRVDSQFFGLEKRVDSTTEITVYRIVQELVNNTIKHANATHVFVQVIKSDEELNITVEDNGAGFNLNEVISKNSAGLNNIRSRVDYLKGEIDIRTSPGNGTSVHIDCRV
jgi:two-component system, NarL family, sensor kinase